MGAIKREYEEIIIQIITVWALILIILELIQIYVHNKRYDMQSYLYSPLNWFDFVGTISLFIWGMRKYFSKDDSEELVTINVS